MKQIILLLIAALIKLEATAQTSMRPGLYMQHNHFYNPASVDLDSQHRQSIVIYGKQQFVDNADWIYDKPANLYANYQLRKSSNTIIHFPTSVIDTLSLTGI